MFCSHIQLVLEIFFIQLIFERDLRSRCDQQRVLFEDAVFSVLKLSRRKNLIISSRADSCVKVWKFSEVPGTDVGQLSHLEYGYQPEKILLNVVFADIVQHRVLFNDAAFANRSKVHR